MNLNSVINKDIKDLMPLFGQMLPQKYVTNRLLGFLKNSELINSLSFTREFTFESAKDLLGRKKGFDLSGRTRARMIKTAIDFLCECDFIERKDAFYSWSQKDFEAYMLSRDEIEKVKAFYGGQVYFFDRCIDYSEEFLSGGAPLFKFDEKSLNVWESFLGNAEYEIARQLLAMLLSSKINGNCNLLNLCPGAGFDIFAVQKLMPDVEITAIDFTDVFRDRALKRAKNPEAVRWVDSSLWKGFGSPLPFNDETFDLVFFSCSDPYIPEGLREFVYKDIFRIIKNRGALGILTNSYPDPEKSGVRDKWIRRGVLCHDFSESVCKGWHGFSFPDSSVRLFKKIGFNVSSILLNGSLWRLDKQ
jgi:ubiquinone/menaquinone biosynthesis C-methylase UbiE